MVTERTLQFDSLERIRNIASISVKHEVPLLGRIVDLVYLQNGRVFTVEFKMRDWRRAIMQAKDHLLGADYSYICMPKRKISKNFKAELKKAKIGLVFHKEVGDWPFEVMIEAPQSNDTWEVARNDIIKYLIGEE